MGTLTKMGDTERQLKQLVVNWKLLDRDRSSVNYYTQEEYSIFPGVVYHYLANPVQKVFPSVDNLVNFVLPGIYFHPDYFLSVHYNDMTERYEGTIIKPRAIDAKSATYTVKFISKKWLINNKYFGSAFTTNPDYVSVWKIYNLAKREFEPPDLEWLNDFVELLNPDSLETLATKSPTPTERTIVCGLKDALAFHKSLNEDTDDQDNSLYLEYYSADDDVMSVIRTFEDEIRSGKGGKGRGKGKQYWYSEGKSQGKGFEQTPSQPPIDDNLRSLLNGECHIINFEGDLFSWVPDSDLRKITVYKNSSKAEDLLTIKQLRDELGSKERQFEVSIEKDHFKKKEERDEQTSD